jgi:HPt (histidine-containing phosphotransfer) domain-containing protein
MRGEMKKFIVRVDPELSDLIPEFLQHKRDDTQAILSGVASDRIDFETLSRIGHRLKGEGGSYGFEAISDYGAEIERAAHSCDGAAVRRYAIELAAYLNEIVIEDK